MVDKFEKPLSDYDRVLFKNAALEMSLVQVRYPPVQRFSNESYMVDIKEALANEYPLVGTEQGMNIVINFQGVSQTPGASLLRFTSIDSRWSVVLSSDFVTLETREYTDIDEFSARFASVLDIVDMYFHPRHRLRFGLRYINEFRFPGGDNYATWRRLLNPELLGLSANGAIGGDVEQTIGEVLFRRNNGHVLVRHGFLKGSTVTPLVNHPTKTGEFYLLDLDYYDDMPVKFDAETPIKRMRSYNTFLYNVFRWSIGEGELYQRLRGEP